MDSTDFIQKHSFEVILTGRHHSQNIREPVYRWAFLVAQMVRNLPAMQETWIQSLGKEQTVEKGMATHSNILTWRIPQTEEPDWIQSM